MQSGIYIPGDGKALVKLRGAGGQYLVAASQYKDAMKVFQLNKKVKTVPLLPADMFAIIKYKNGTGSKQEFYNGQSFLSQSGRFFIIDGSMKSVTITDNTGHKRDIPIN